MCVYQPLQVALQPFIVCDMDEALLYKSDKEDVMKNVFDQAKQYVQHEIQGSLAEYRNKSLLGMFLSISHCCHPCMFFISVDCLFLNVYN
jgi:hypothetical protein